jgi:hypothetical protein
VKLLDRGVQALAAVLAASLAVAAWHDVSKGYDVWYYHLPFAARLTGVMDASTYAFSAENQARYEGFPLLAEALQGLVWRLTGHVEATSLVALAALFALPLALRRLFDVPPHVALLALLAIPLVHIHATAGYIDLPANACATLLLFCVYRALVSRRVSTRGLLVAGGLAAATANMKFQLVPIVVLASLTMAVVALRERRSVKRFALVAVLAPLVFATPLKNAARHGNPVWPIELTIAGQVFPHTENAYAQSPPNLAEAPKPVRFLHSILELESRPIASKRRWSIDQWAPSDDPTCRMGGYFGAYVALNLVALGVFVWRRRQSREALAAAALFAGVTVVASAVPQSHELRYYMHWMLLLVSLNLILWSREGPVARLALGAVALATLGVVVWATDAGYVYASGTRFADFVDRRTERSIIDSAQPGERLCIDRPPNTFLYAAPFHGRHDYAVQEAADESDCRGARPIP